MGILAGAALAAGTAAASAAAPVATAASIGASALGGVAGIVGDQAAGKNAVALGNYQQQQYQQEADTSVARAQRKMLEEQRKGQLVQSQLVARGAGAGIDPSVGSTNVLSQQIAGRTEYSALSDLAGGQDVAAGYENVGEADVYQGQLTASTEPQREIGTAASAAGSIFNTLGKTNFGGAAAYG
jgi:hypothetical protein